MNDSEQAPLQRVAVKDGVAHPVEIRWGTRPGPRGHAIYELQVDGPFGSPRGEGNDLFAALQQARRTVERAGWILAVEGARLHTHPSGMQRDMGGGLVAYRLEKGPGPYPERGILEPADPAECGTVVDQERWYEQWSAPTPRPARTVVGRGWSIVHPDLSNGRRVYRPLVSGKPMDLSGTPVVYGDRVEALAAGDDKPVSVPLDRLGAEYPGGAVIDPGHPWTWRGIPAAPRKLPRSGRATEEQAGPLVAVLPAARVFGMTESAARLVVLPAGTDLRHAADALAVAVGEAIIPPYVLVVAGAEPSSIRRSLRGR